MPVQFGYKSVMHVTTVPRDDNVATTELWPGPVHDYRDAHTASIRNNNRVSQLLCSKVVIGALRRLNPERYMEDRRYRAAVYRVQYVVDDIAASVPFNLGYSSQQSAAANAKQRAEGPGTFLSHVPATVANSSKQAKPVVHTSSSGHSMFLQK